MLLLAHSVSRLSYLQRCLPSAALMDVANDWDDLLKSAAATVLELADDEIAMPAVEATLRRPRRLGGFGLASAAFISPLAFIASVAQSAAQSGSHPLAADTLPTTSLLHQWLHAALTCPTIGSLLGRRAVQQLHPRADTFTGHYHAQPNQAASLQSKLSTAATKSLYNARKSEVKRSGDLRGLARLHGGRAKYAARWKLVKPTERTYRLPDEFYRYSARRDLGLGPTKDRVLPRRCTDCGLSYAADGYHGQRCNYNSGITKLRHDSIETLLHNTVQEGVGMAYRQQRNLPDAARTIPDLLIHLDGKQYLCDVVVSDTLAKTNLRVPTIAPRDRPGWRMRRRGRSRPSTVTRPLPCTLFTCILCRNDG